VGVTAGTFASLSTDPESLTAVDEADGITAGSLFKAAGLILGVDPAAKGEVNDPGCVCVDNGGLLVESNSRIGTGAGAWAGFGTGEGSRLDGSTVS
jgi:hypothetical protein